VKKGKIGAVITYYEKPKELSYVLTSLKKQTKKLYEIVVVDDQSSTDFGEKLCKEMEIKYIRQEYPTKEFRAGQARNKGWKELDSEYILFVDGDILLDKEYVEKALTYLNNNPGDMISGDVIMSIPVSEIEKKKVGDLFLKKVSENLEIRDLHWDFLGSNQFVISRKIMKKYGGFDENYYGWGEEDTELFYRFFKDGVKIKLNPEMKALHFAHSNNFASHMKTIRRNAEYTIKKHPEMKDMARRAWYYFHTFDTSISIRGDKPDFLLPIERKT